MKRLAIILGTLMLICSCTDAGGDQVPIPGKDRIVDKKDSNATTDSTFKTRKSVL